MYTIIFIQFHILRLQMGSTTFEIFKNIMFLYIFIFCWEGFVYVPLSYNIHQARFISLIR